MDRRGGVNLQKAARPPPVTATEAWLNAIQDATECVTPVDRSSRFGNEEDIAASLSYLEILASILEQHSEEWDDVPMGAPPQQFAAEQHAQYSALYTGYHDAPLPTVTIPSSWNDSGNRFATFQYDDDSDEEQEAGDSSFTPSPISPPTSTETHTHLSMRRLMIRIVTAQSEVYACQASHSPPQWQRGASLYQMSLFKIHHALSLADSECAKWLEQGNIPSSLKGDANVVEVAIQYLTKQTDKFRNYAQNKERQLMQRLEPQWKTRDDIKERWGSERWNNNPRPKRNFAALREADEEQLHEIRAALLSLDEMDTQGAVQSSQELKDQVTSGSRKKKGKKVKRDNGLRPTDLSKRMPMSEFPDPTEFGWEFTGSGDNTVEYFQLDGIELDWYFTTAGVKIFQGKKFLYGGRVTPNTYLEILLNPRAHTNKGNQHGKQSQKEPRWS